MLRTDTDNNMNAHDLLVDLCTETNHDPPFTLVSLVKESLQT